MNNTILKKEKIVLTDELIKEVKEAFEKSKFAQTKLAKAKKMIDKGILSIERIEKAENDDLTH